MNEPWNTVLLLIVIPLMHQLFKLYKDKTGKTLSKVANQAISLVLASVFALLTGGFVGLGLPAFPVWANDLLQFVSDMLIYLKDWVAVFGLAWGAVMAVYELVWDKLFVRFNIATADKY